MCTTTMGRTEDSPPQQQLKRRANNNTSFSSKSLRGNISRYQFDRDPLFYYTIHDTAGVGSVGKVVRVSKRDEVVGGSARQDLQVMFERERAGKSCSRIPLVGCFVQTLFHKPLEYNSSEHLSWRSWHSNLQHNNHKSQSSIRSGTTASTSSTTYTATSSHQSQSTTASSVSLKNYAMKSIHLDLVKQKSVLREFRNEIEVLKRIDHPNVVRLIETFDYQKKLYVVMEHCSGGDLYSRDPYSEDQANRIIRSVLGALTFMHDRKIMHRDIKFENVLFVDDSPTSDVKLIDFGLSKRYRTNVMTERVGTIYTMAPEVLKGRYGIKADVWSVGVIAYMLLCSQVPFVAENAKQIVEKVIAGVYTFKSDRWENISEEAMGFIKELLVVDAKKRPSAMEAARSPWLNRTSTKAFKPSKSEEAKLSLLRYARFPRLKKMAMMIVAHNSTSNEIGTLKDVFQDWNTSNNGELCYDEFVTALSDFVLDKRQLPLLFDQINVGGSGSIRYTEFLAATIEMNGPIMADELAEAFDRLDSDDSGSISSTNLKGFLGAGISMEEIDSIIQEANPSNGSTISYSHFLSLWTEPRKPMEEVKEVNLHSTRERAMSELC